MKRIVVRAERGLKSFWERLLKGRFPFVTFLGGLKTLGRVTGKAPLMTAILHFVGRARISENPFPENGYPEIDELSFCEMYYAGNFENIYYNIYHTKIISEFFIKN